MEGAYIILGLIVFGVFAMGLCGSAACTKNDIECCKNTQNKTSWEDFCERVGEKLNGKTHNGKPIWFSKDRKLIIDGEVYQISYFEIMNDGRWTLRGYNFNETVVYTGKLKP